MTAPNLRVLLVDDEALGRQRLEDLLRHEADVEIAGFADKGNGAKLNDVIDLSAIAGITKFEGALASATTKVAAHSVAYYFSSTLNETLILANAGASALSQTSAKLMEIELAGGHFRLAASNFKLA